MIEYWLYKKNCILLIESNQLKFMDIEEMEKWYGKIWLPPNYTRELSVEISQNKARTLAGNNNDDVDLLSGNYYFNKYAIFFF